MCVFITGTAIALLKGMKEGDKVYFNPDINLGDIRPAPNFDKEYTVDRTLILRCLVLKEIPDECWVWERFITKKEYHDKNFNEITDKLLGDK